MNKIHLPSINIVIKIFRCLNAWYNRHMEKPSFKRVIIINGFSLHQNGTNVNMIFLRETDHEEENRKEKNLKLRYMYELYL